MRDPFELGAGSVARAAVRGASPFAGVHELRVQHKRGHGRWAWAALWLLFAALAPLDNICAHHSSAVYDMTKRVTVMGTVTKVMWVNPHAYFFLDAKDAAGNVTTWHFFLDSPNELMRRGWPRSTLKPGDVVTVEAAPGRGDPTRAFAWEATFPDGRKVLRTYDAVPDRNGEAPQGGAK